MKRLFKIIISLLIVTLTFLTSYTYNIERISADENICHIDGNRILFQEPINITSEAVWQNELCIMDLDNDNYPEIISGLCEMKTEFGNYQDGLHSFEFNYGNFSHTFFDFNDSLGSVREINMKGDEYPDLIFSKSVLIESSYHIMAYSIINDNGNLSLQNWSFIVVNNNSLSDFTIGDIDADGLYDFIANSAASSDFIHPGINTGNSSFVNDGWNNGLPSFDSKHPDSSHKYEASDEVLCDLNNDGWLDICSATGNSGASGNTGPFRCYNYISDGKGNWSEFSENFPEYEWGRNLAVADIDNDGDLDVLLATTRNYDNWIPAKYLYENDDGKGWIQRPFPEEFEYFSSNHREVFDDIDQDGNMDLLMIQTIPTYDNHDKVNGYDSEVWIAFGNGDWTWDLVKQGTFFNGGQSYHTSIYDIDLDGDKDLIFAHSMTGNYAKGGLVWFPNTLTNKPILSFTEKPLSPHMRGGSIQHFEWTYTESDDPRMMKDEFDLSISYSGNDGPFFPLETGLKRWWRDVIMPNIPSREVYFRLSHKDHIALCGPYTIHVDDFSDIVKLEKPSDGSILYPDETMEFNLKSSRQFEGGTVTIILDYENDLIEVGKIHIEKNGSANVKWKVPDLGKDLICRIELEYDFNGKHISQYSGKNIILASFGSIPKSIEYATFDCPMENFSKLPFVIRSNDGSDITSVCSYQTQYNPYEMEIETINGKNMMVKPLKSGKLELTLVASKYGKFVSSEIILYGYKPIESIEIITPERDIIAGEEFMIEFYTYDDNGTLWIPEENEYDLSIDGNYIIIDIDLPKITMMATDEGNLKFNFSIKRPGIHKTIEMDIFPYFSKVSITPDQRYLFVNDEINLDVSVLDHTYSPTDNFTIKFDIKGPCTVLGTGPDRTIIPTGSGEIDITTTVVRYQEKKITKIEYLVIREIGMMEFNSSIDKIEVGTSQEISTSLMDIDNRYVIEYHTISDIKYSSNLQVKWDHGFDFSISGIRTGKDSIEISVDLYGRERTFLFDIEVVEYPRKIMIELPDVLTLGKEFICDISVYNSINVKMKEYTTHIESSGIEVNAMEEEISLKGKELGEGWLRINVSSNGVFMEYFKIIDVIFDPVSIITERVTYIGYKGSALEIHPYLSDNDGNHADWNQWIVDCPDFLEIEQSNGTILILSEEVGNHSVSLRMEYGEIELERLVFIEIREPSIISEIEVWHSHLTRMVEVRVIDQYGSNVTHLCEINWSGNFQKIEDFKVIYNSNEIRFKVLLNGTEREMRYDLRSDENGGTIGPMILVSLFIIGLIISTIVAIIVIRRNRMKKYEEY